MVHHPPKMQDQTHGISGETAEAWLHEFGDAMYTFAMVRLGDPHLAEDLVQDTLLAAMTTPSPPAHDRTRAWLFATLRHKVVDVIRASMRTRDLEAELIHIAQQFQGCGCHGQGQLKVTERDDLQPALRAAIAGLPPLMRECFCFRVIDQMKTEEVCQVLGITPTNMWTLVHRAKQRLHIALGEVGHGP